MQEGFEQVLSVDYKTRRLGPRSISGRARGSLREVTNAMQSASAESTTLNGVEAPPAKISRRTSMLGRIIGADVEAPNPVEKQEPDLQERGEG